MTPIEAVAQYVAKHLRVPGFCVAYSGGMDSHVLLALMSDLARRDRSLTVRAVHIDHSLQAQSAGWSDHAESICNELGVPLEVRKIKVVDSSDGPEGSARRARYREFANVLQPGEHLLLAQHAEDQAETFLLQALRGSGPDGLAAIPRKRRFARGFMGRPLLYCPKKLIVSLAEKRKLDWIEDPSNQAEEFDRNFLRMQIMPLLKSRWPAAPQTLGRSATRCAAVSQSLNSFAQQDLESVTQAGLPALRVSALVELPKERAFAAIRLWVRQRNLRMPRLQDLRQVYQNLLIAKSDSQGIVNVREYEFRRHRDSLYILLPGESIKGYRYHWQPPYNDLFIAETGLTVTRRLCEQQRIRLPETGTVIVKSRAGGELIRVGNPPFHKQVKQILQETQIPPWKRRGIPLLYVEGQLIAVWNLAVATRFYLTDEKLKAADDSGAPNNSAKVTSAADSDTSDSPPQTA
jgi:tRNA(Ile)-lysidine synthase